MSESSEKFVIGSYKPKTEVIEKRASPPTPAKSMAEGIQEELSQGLDAAEDNAKKSKDYTEILKDKDVELDYAHAVVDDLMTKGYHEVTMPLTKKHSVTFRTRLHADYMRYCRALELFNPRYVDEQQEIAVRYFLAASLVACKGVLFKRDKENDEEFSARLEWIEKQPEILTKLLAEKLRIFDTKIQVIMSEGVIENF